MKCRVGEPCDQSPQSYVTESKCRRPWRFKRASTCYANISHTVSTYVFARGKDSSAAFVHQYTLKVRELLQRGSVERNGSWGGISSAIILLWCRNLFSLAWEDRHIGSLQTHHIMGNSSFSVSCLESAPDRHHSPDIIKEHSEQRSMTNQAVTSLLLVLYLHVFSTLT